MAPASSTPTQGLVPPCWSSGGSASRRTSGGSGEGDALGSTAAAAGEDGALLGVGVGAGVALAGAVVGAEVSSAAGADVLVRGAGAVGAGAGARGDLAGEGAAVGGDACRCRAGGGCDGGSPAPNAQPSTVPGSGSYSAAPRLLKTQRPPGAACQ